MDILIFRTNVSNLQQAQNITLLLSDIGVQRVTFDLEDCDRVMRIEAENISPQTIESLLLLKSIECKELK